MISPSSRRTHTRSNTTVWRRQQMTVSPACWLVSHATEVMIMSIVTLTKQSQDSICRRMARIQCAWLPGPSSETVIGVTLSRGLPPQTEPRKRRPQVAMICVWSVRRDSSRALLGPRPVASVNLTARQCRPALSRVRASVWPASRISMARPQLVRNARLARTRTTPGGPVSHVPPIHFIWCRGASIRLRACAAPGIRGPTAGRARRVRQTLTENTTQRPCHLTHR